MTNLIPNITTNVSNIQIPQQLNKVVEKQAAYPINSSDSTNKNEEKNTNHIIKNIALGGVGVGITTGTTLYGNKKGQIAYTNEKAALKKSLENELDKLKHQKFSKDVIDIFDELNKCYVDQTILKKEGEKYWFPNGIMLIGPDKKASNSLVEWTAKKSHCNFVSLVQDSTIDIEKRMDDFFDTLEDLKKQNIKDHKNALYYVENFEDLINPKINTAENIDQLKAAMCVLDNEYKTTLIFGAVDPSKLSIEATAPHRIEHRINLNSVASKEITNVIKAEDELVQITKKLQNIDNLPKTIINKNKKIGVAVGIGISATLLIANYLFNKHNKRGVK